MKRRQMQIGEAELRSMTRDLDEAHRASLPAVRESLAEFSENARTSRRGFLAASGLAVGALGLAACGRSGTASPASRGSSGGMPTGSPSGLQGDLRVVALAAALENLAVGAYDAGIAAATAGKLGAVPPAVVTFATTARAHHRDHAAAWNGVLEAAGSRAITGVPLTIKPQIDQQLAAVKDVPGLAELALSLEDVAAATYLSGIGTISDRGGIKTAAAILPVETQHAAILTFVLGKYPVPKTFRTTDGAVDPSALTA